VKMPFWLRELQRNFCAVFLLPYVAFLFATAVVAPRSRWRVSNPANVLALISLSWIFVTAALFALNINDHSRYLMGLFPYVGIVVCWTLSRVRSNTWLGIFAVLCGLQFVLVLAQAFAYIPPLPQFPGYLVPWERSSKGLENIYFAVDRTCEPGSVSAVGVQLPDFNEQALSFYAAVRHPEVPCTYFGLPVHELQLTVEEVWARLNRQVFRYYIYRTFTDAGGYDWANKFSRVMLANIEASPGFRARPDKGSPELLIFESYRAPQDGKVVRGVTPEGVAPFGYLEEPAPGAVLSNEVVMSGWVVAPTGLGSIDACFGPIGEDAGKRCWPAKFIERGATRNDVAKAYPGVPGALNSGFRGSVNVVGVPTGRYRLTLVAHGMDGSAREITSIPVYLQHFVKDSLPNVKSSEDTRQHDAGAPRS
jgi:hypothetical protein